MIVLIKRSNNVSKRDKEEEYNHVLYAKEFKNKTKTCAGRLALNDLYLHVLDLDSDEQEIDFADDDVTEVVSETRDYTHVQQRESLRRKPTEADIHVTATRTYLR